MTLAALALLGVTLALTFIDLLSNLTDGRLFATLEQGHLAPWLFAPEFWAAYPGLGVLHNPQVLVDVYALGVVGLSLALLWIVVRRWLRLGAVALASVWLGAGTLIFAIGNDRLGAGLTPHELGALLAFMFMSALYCTAAALLALLWFAVRGDRVNARTAG